jgi:hypothetical protein
LKLKLEVKFLRRLGSLYCIRGTLIAWMLQP